jgi:hypothetical protein
VSAGKPGDYRGGGVRGRLLHPPQANRHGGEIASLIDGSNVLSNTIGWAAIGVISARQGGELESPERVTTCAIHITGVL